MAVTETLARLENLDFEGANPLGELYQIADSLTQEDPEGESVEAVLGFIEDHPDEDLGTPGPLVHFVERFAKKGYEEKLIESLKRKAGPMGAWMLNRIINGASAAERPPYIEIMSELTRAPDADVAERAAHYLERLQSLSLAQAPAGRAAKV